MRNYFFRFAIALCLLPGTSAFSQQSTVQTPTPAQTAAAPTPQIPSRLVPGSIVYIVPNQGYEIAISAAIAKKKVPLVISEKESAAPFRIESVTIFKKPSMARGVLLGSNFTGYEMDASFRVVDVKTGVVVYSYDVHKFESHMEDNVRSTSEAFAKRLKNFMIQGGPAA